MSKAKTVQRAFDNIVKKESMSDIDRKLIDSLDQDIIRLLEGFQMDGETKKLVLFPLGEQEQNNDLVSLDRERESIFSEKREEIHTMYLETKIIAKE